MTCEEGILSLIKNIIQLFARAYHAHWKRSKTFMRKTICIQL